MYLLLNVVCFWVVSFPLGALDRLQHLIVALPEPSIQLIGYKIIDYWQLTARFSWPFKIWGYSCDHTGKMLLPHILMEQSETWFKQHRHMMLLKVWSVLVLKICQWLNDSFIYLASFVLVAFKFWLKGIFSYIIGQFIYISLHTLYIILKLTNTIWQLHNRLLSQILVVMLDILALLQVNDHQ